ncbi:UDP-N-acetylenolpyruvoylglucosamine reductase [Candidatus Uhrbacteria bacterium CG10_big_fil_rev_8_21_14_0_10_50_16]|uniref:UDP-N-acetylenolpyruvoylglucosamine reductase n=1 Tax=Candidatus Uhrbacteria bacterium CG10_big_fil_rev_8_21_14_0_10_50_16 TaxID=1975039 RepID=A0A2H0RP70_9BACT|nr:MAG: UDP-N-acetylenolpyruvoylglucosamine reductase [Candidatus Uhrbacteria bacterium CG10_big_fil_rev_8_21_14_0_10_50_16]
MNTQFEQQVEALLGDRLKRGEPLAAHSHYGVGGPASYFVLAKTAEEVTSLVQLAKDENVPWVVIGGGTNILVSDKGFNGLVIKMGNRSIRINHETGEVVADAGLLSSSLARQTGEAGLTGFEWGIGLPGTIGGAVRGNAGCFGGETKDKLVSVDILNTETGEVQTIAKEDLVMGYRHSKIKDVPWIVLRATFLFEPREVDLNREAINEVLRCRMDSQPKNVKCAGCAFKNVDFVADEDIAKLKDRVHDIPEAFLTNKRIPAGWLVDRLGLKGTRVGGAAISELHGNFITSDGTATADQLMQLIALVKSKVRDAYGIQLHEEVQFIGFDT